MNKKDIRIGMRVVCTKTPDFNDRAFQQYGTVLEPIVGDRSGWVAVEFDNDIGGHSCDGRGTPDYCWFCPASSLEPLETPLEKIKVHFDEIV